MTKRILEILDNVRYWDTCPDEYKKDIETFLEVHNQALHIHDVVGRSEQLKAFMHFAEFAKQEYRVHIPLNLMKEYVKSL